SEKTVDNYLDLIYGDEAEVDENESNESDGNIPSGGTRQYWQYTHRQFSQRMTSHDQSHHGRNELWEVPTNIALVAVFLDPRFKHFNWTTSIERNKTLNLIKTLYNELKINLTIPNDNEENLADRNCNDEDDEFFYDYSSDNEERNNNDDEALPSTSTSTSNLK
ncbi:38161_t:CDS:2, partial [Gigaspora margarita]